MGSFNTTCAVSKAPILDGQKVRVFFLIMNAFPIHYYKRNGQFKNSFMGSNCYPWDHFKIVGYPMLATYDDYNRYVFDDQEMEDLNLKIINKIYKPNLIADGKTVDDYNSSHDYLNIDKIESMHQLQKIEHSGSLRVKTCHGESAIAKMAIHEDIYQQMILGNTKDKTSKFQSFVKEEVNKFLEEKSSKDKLSEEKREKIKNIRLTLEKSIGTKDRSNELITKEYVEEAIETMTKMLSRDDMDFTTEPEKWLSETYPRKDIKKYEFVDKIIEAWVGTKWTANWFECNNLEFLPVVTSSQCYDFDYNASILRKMANIIGGLTPSWEDEERLKLDSEWTEKVTLKFSEIEEKFNDWFSESDDEFKEYISAIDEIKALQLERFEIGDGSKFDKLVEEYGLFKKSQKGLKVYFK